MCQKWEGVLWTFILFFLLPFGCSDCFGLFAHFLHYPPSIMTLVSPCLIYHLSERNFGMRFMILLDDTYTGTSMVCSFTVNTRALYRTKQERRLSNIQLNTLCNGISCWYSTTSVFTHLVKSEVTAWKLNDLQDLFLYIEGVFWCILQYRSSKNDFQPDISTSDEDNR